jgi:hypothetical protein
MLASRWKVVVTPALFFYAGYTLMAAFTIAWARYPDDTMRDAQRILGNLLFYFYVINALREYSLAKAVLAVWLAASVGCALCTACTTTTSGLTTRWKRARWGW